MEKEAQTSSDLSRQLSERVAKMTARLEQQSQVKTAQSKEIEGAPRPTALTVSHGHACSSFAQESSCICGRYNRV